MLTSFLLSLLINQFSIYLLYKKSLSYENNNCAIGRRRKTASAVCRKSRTPSAGTTAAILHRKYTLQSLIWMKVNFFFVLYFFFVYIFFYIFTGTLTTAILLVCRSFADDFHFIRPQSPHIKYRPVK